MRPSSICETAGIVLDYHPNDHIDPPFSHIWVWGITGVLTYCMIRSILYRVQSNRMASEADASIDPNAILAPGARFVSGKVEYARDEAQAISVHIKQEGSETKTKNGYTHRWTEVDRSIQARPFYVRRSNGERVRIEPGENPLLVDKPDQIQKTRKNLRTRIAALTPGEDVIVQGELTKGADVESADGGDYRHVSQGWVMRPANGQRMEVSAEKLGDRHRKRAKSFRQTAWAMVWILGFIHLLFVYYDIRFFGGEDTCATVQRKDIVVTTNSKGQRTNHYTVYLHVDEPHPELLSDTLDRSDWNQVEPGAVLAFHYVAARPTMSAVGTSTSTNVMTIIFAAIAGLVGISIYAATLSYRRWYEGRLDDTGSGPLPDP